MKKFTSLLIGAMLSAVVVAQNESPYEFKTVVDHASTEVKDQCQTGTCWSYSTVSFIESELIRMGKGEHDLSEMFNVRMTYPEKAENYMRYQGKAQFSAGSLSHDVMNVIEEHGMVPNEVYTGLDNGETVHNHGEMDLVLSSVLKALTEKRRGPLSDDWMDAVHGILDAYLGEVPEKFDYQGKEYTPESFRDEMGINPDDYVSISSFSHHDFGDEFILEVPDNFSQGSFYNVPLEDLVSIAEIALKSGYTLAWDADVSEKGFSFSNGVAINPDKSVKKEDMFKEVVKEMDVDQETRQAGFDNFQTTDDHLMHFTGIAEDQNGETYFMMKNSWGTENPFGGRQYVSMSYFKMKTISIMVHKDALTKDMKKELGL